MTNNNDLHTQDWREWRRLRAYELYQQGWKQCAIASALGVSKGSVSQWLSRARAEGATALHKRTIPGAPARLTPEQKAQIPSLLERGPDSFGLSGRRWTYARIAAVVEKQWQVSYDPAYVARLLKAHGWKTQRVSRLSRTR